MPEKNSTIRELHTRNRNLWQIVLLLIVLVAVTIALIVTILYPFVHHSDYEISIYQGMISSRQSSARTTSADAVSTTDKLNSAQAQEFDFSVSDNEEVWSTGTTIDLFHTSYKNTKGQITVRSADTGKVVAPGTGGSYTFSLKNTSSLNSNYQVWLEANVNVESSELPIEFRMSGSEGWTDGKGEWLTADELDKTVSRKNLYSGKSAEYTLYWRWDFDRGEDEIDTSYGNIKVGETNVSGGQMNIDQTISYKITLHTLAEEGLIGENITPTSVPAATITPGEGTPGTANTNKNSSDSGTADSNAPTDNNGSHIGKTVKTGDSTPVEKWLLLIGAAALTICTAAVLRRRKEKNQEGR